MSLVRIYGLPQAGISGDFYEKRREAYHDLSLLADEKKNRLLNWLEERRDDARVLAYTSTLSGLVDRVHAQVLMVAEPTANERPPPNPLGARAEYHELRAHLNTVRNAYGIYKTIGFADSETGRVFVSTRQGDREQNQAQPAAFARALRLPGDVVFKVVPGKSASDFVLQIILAPLNKVLGARTPRAVLLMTVDPRDFVPLLLKTGLGLGTTGEALLINEQTKILSTLKHKLADGTQAIPLQHTITARPATLAARGEEGIIQATDYRGVPVMAAFRHIRISPDMGWGLVVKQDETEVFAALRRSIKTTTVLGIFSLVVLVALTWLIATRLSRPLRQLSDTANRVINGDLSSRAPVHGNDEVGMLASLFNAMVGRIERTHIELQDAVLERTRKLTASEERFRAVAESAIDAIISADSQGNIILWNPAAERIFGYTQDEIIGRPLTTIMPERYREAHIASVTRLAGGGNRYLTEKTVELSGLRKNGLEVPLDVAISHWEAGGEQFFTGILRDVTERERTKRALEANEQRIRSLLESTSEGIYGIDTDGHCTFANPACVRLLGYAETADLLGKDMHQLLHHSRADGSEYPVEDCHIYRACHEGDSIHIDDEVFWRADGSSFPAEYWSSPIRENDEITGTVVTFMDISQRQATQDALRQREMELVEAQRIARMGNWDWDLVGSELRWSDEAYRIFGMNPQGFGINYEAFMEAVHPLDRESVQVSVNAALKGEPYSIDHRIVLPNGEERTVHEQGVVHFDADGNAVHMTGTVQDITERKQLEEEQVELIVQLEKQNEELERFTYTVSHDLKSPLVTIKGFAGQLTQDLSKGRQDRMADDAERIERAAEHMHELLDDLLELSIVGQVANAPEDVSLSAVVDEAAGLLSAQFAERDVRLEVAPDLPVVSVDRIRLLEVIQNLMENAVKFMGDQTSPLVEVGVREAEGEVICFVRDNGSGIDPRHQHKAFAIFERMHPEIEGTGIGLALAKRIVETHGGRIWLESEGEGHGSTFYFWLPGKAQTGE
ncbi:MAG: hypothetical protein DRQ37_06850 [Gammaproteobacteria bacterium]|nr:MAG: hypothetical protein DRQ37_06850 [Gammaproteobacteria bacterium]